MQLKLGWLVGYRDESRFCTGIVKAVEGDRLLVVADDKVVNLLLANILPPF